MLTIAFIIALILSLLIVGTAVYCSYNYTLLQVIFPNMFTNESYSGDMNPVLFSIIFLFIFLVVMATIMGMSRTGSLFSCLFIGSTLIPAIVCFAIGDPSSRAYYISLVVGLVAGLLGFVNIESSGPHDEWGILIGLPPSILLIFDGIYMNICIYREFVSAVDVDAFTKSSALIAIIPTAIISVTLIVVEIIRRKDFFRYSFY